jgi:penicillin-binding protein 2
MNKGHLDQLELRLQAFRILVVVAFVALGLRFWMLQVAEHAFYRQQAENNRIREIPIPAPRGAILDRNGIPLVDNTPAFNIVLTPELITDTEETIRALVEELGADRDRLISELNNPKRQRSQPILVKQNATPADRAWVAAHEYEHPEITIEQQPQRIYKYGKLACHVLGYISEITPAQLEDPRYVEAGYKPGDIIGQAGVEAFYDRILRGKDGIRRVLVDSRGRPIRELERIEPTRGQDIVLTLDLELQKIAEELFDASNQTGVAIAMNPQNGEILAMVSRPAFDPNVFAENLISSQKRDEVRRVTTDPASPLYNKAIQGRYPTGSTWKILVAAAALEEGIIAPQDSSIYCGGGIQMGNRFVKCMGSHGSPDLHAALVRSCDGYFYRLGLKLGIEKMRDWLIRFGAGQKTGIDLPGEVKPIIPDPGEKKRFNPRDPNWRDFDTVIASVGQGQVAISPLQLLYAETGIIMGGRYYTPHVFKEARPTALSPAKRYQDNPTLLKLSPLTVEAICRAAWGVVNEGGTAAGVGFPRELDVGGKTGTAQVITKEKVRKREHRDHSWFVSFAPIRQGSEPELAVVVLTEHGGFGAEASAPKAKIIHAAYFSKKLGRPLLPELAHLFETPLQ